MRQTSFLFPPDINFRRQHSAPLRTLNNLGVLLPFHGCVRATDARRGSGGVRKNSNKDADATRRQETQRCTQRSKCRCMVVTSEAYWCHGRGAGSAASIPAFSKGQHVYPSSASRFPG